MPYWIILMACMINTYAINNHLKESDMQKTTFIPPVRKPITWAIIWLLFVFATYISVRRELSIKAAIYNIKQPPPKVANNFLYNGSEY